MQWLMLQQDEPDDLVIATGEQHSVRDFVAVAAREVGMDIRWEGAGVDEKGYDRTTGACIVEVDPRYFRPTEVETLLGDASKAKAKLGWVPEISFAELVREMMREDLRGAERDDMCRREGYQVFSRTA
jgi:GDPmannose 4,6-dehydratase